MGQFAISPISRAADFALDGSAVSVGNEQRALTRDVAAAVRQVNESGYAGEGREVAFSVDRATRKPVVRVVETSTREVISQWPAAYVLQLAAQSQDKRDSG